MFYLQNLI